MPRTLRRPVALATAALLGLGLTSVVAVPANAASFTAGTSAELVQAIFDANDAAGPDTLTLTADIVLEMTLPIILDELTIVGGGYEVDGVSHLYGVFVSDADLTVSDMRIVDAGGSAIDVIASAMTVTDVDITDPEADGIYFVGESATVSDVTVSGSDYRAIDTSVTVLSSITGVTLSENLGQGLVVDVSDAGSVHLDDVVATANRYESVVSAHDSGTVSLTNSLFAGTAEGSGLDVFSDSSGALTVSDTEFSGNYHYGVSLTASGTGAVQVRDSTAADNGGVGVAIEATADAVVEAHDIESSNNEVGLSVNLYGGELVAARVTSTGNGAGAELWAHEDGSEFSVADSTFSGNEQGLELYLHDDEDDNETPALGTLERSTVSGNGGAIRADVSDGASLSVVNSTVSGNDASGGAAIDVSGEPGSSFAMDLTTVTDNTVSTTVYTLDVDASVTNSIIGGNQTTYDDLYSIGDLVVDYSLIETVVEPAIQADIDAGTGNLVGQAPQLAPLTDNGGLNLTHLPLAGSPVLNAGDPALVTPATDQRGDARVQRGTVDLGSVETDMVPAPRLAATGRDASAAPFVAGGALLALGLLLGIASARRRRSA